MVAGDERRLEASLFCQKAGHPQSDRIWKRQESSCQNGADNSRTGGRATGVVRGAGRVIISGSTGTAKRASSKAGPLLCFKGRWTERWS